MQTLYRLLIGRRNEVIEAWAAVLRSAAGETPLSPAELVDHVPQFLDDLTEALRLQGEKSAYADAAATAATHGLQRFHVGFDLDSVIREYGLLHRCIIELAHREGVAIDVDEHRILIRCIYDGLADAVAQYSHQRDAELRRQANEHFGFIAHELRNPLTSAQLAFSSLQERGKLPASSLVEVVARGLRRTKELVEATLTMSLAAGSTELKPERIDLRSLLREAIADSSIAAADKNIEVKVEPERTMEIEGDRRLLYSALTNIVGNAVKFTPNGGSIHVGWHDAEDHVTVDVDDGCGGLPPGASDKMFAPFVQVGTDRSGYGLGLAIARQAVQAHGGSIHVRNRPHAGCTFSIVLPKPVAPR